MPNATETASAARTAELLVDNNLEGLGHTAETLNQIALLLAQHFVAVNDDDYRLKSERTGDASATYEGRSDGEGLRGSRYGQQAIVLDHTGTLAGLGRAAASVTALGALD
jgi:hypothetical protein